MKLNLLYFKIVSISVFLLTNKISAQVYDKDPSIGINSTIGYNTDPAFVDQSINRIKDLGLSRVRMGLDHVSGGKLNEPFTFSGRDVVVNKLLAAGIKIHAAFGPRFHVEHGGADYNIDYNTWKSNWEYFCKGVMTQYKGKIFYYIVDNEPDLEYPIGKVLTPQQCVDFTKIAYDVAKSIDPKIMIESTPTKSQETDYLKEIIGLGITKYCDYLGVHSYGGQIDDWRLVRPWEFMQQYPQFPQRPVALSETGLIPQWAPAGIDGNLWRARYFQQLNVQIKTFGFANVLLFDMDGTGDWGIYGTPTWAIVKEDYQGL